MKNYFLANPYNSKKSKSSKWQGKMKHKTNQSSKVELDRFKLLNKSLQIALNKIFLIKASRYRDKCRRRIHYKASNRRNSIAHPKRASGLRPRRAQNKVRSIFQLCTTTWNQYWKRRRRSRALNLTAKFQTVRRPRLWRHSRERTSWICSSPRMCWWIRSPPTRRKWWSQSKQPSWSCSERDLMLARISRHRATASKPSQCWWQPRRETPTQIKEAKYLRSRPWMASNS